MVFLGEQIASSEEVLSCGNQRRSIFGNADIFVDLHQNTSFSACFFCLRHVDVHFVAIEVSVVRCAAALIEAKCAIVHDFSSVSHNRDSV